MSMKLAVICFKNWRFLTKLHERWSELYDVRTYDGYRSRSKFIAKKEPLKGFIENRLVNKRIDELMKWSDVAFFEWASNYLELGTHMPKRGPIAARLHRWEIFKFAEKIKWNNIDRLVFVGQAMRDWTLERIDFPKTNTTVIHNATDTKFFRQTVARTEPTNRLGILGGVIPRKRVYELVLAFKELTSAMPERPLTLSIAGGMEGEYPEFIKNLIQRLELQKKVKLEGHVEDIVEWYNSIDIIVSNSMHESAHLTIQEGKACGCYPIAHHWDGVTEFLEKERLYLTNTEFCKRVGEFYELPESKRNSIQKQGREDVEKRFAFSVIAKQYDELFRKLV